MGFWIFMLIMDMMIPLIMIGFGKLFLNRAPKEINPVYGYRTSMSMKNKDTWEFAHAYFGKVWFRIGIVMLPVSIIPLFFVLGRNTNTVGMVGGALCIVQCVVLLVSIFPVEKALKRNFDSNGRRRSEAVQKSEGTQIESR